MSQARKNNILRSLLIGIIIAAILVITLVWIMSGIGIIPSTWSTIISIICTILSVAATLLPFLSASQTTLTPSPSPLVTSSLPVLQTGDASSTTTHRGIMSLPPPTNDRIILQRESVVQEIYTHLTDTDLTAVVLTGIGGAGKSTLAALVHQYAEVMRERGTGPFTAAPLWLQIVPSATIDDITGTIFAALEKPVPDFRQFFPHDQVTHLFKVLNTIDKPRLIILDQFEHVLDWQTGKARADRPGIGELLDAMNSQPCHCRLLLTSRPLPRGMHTYPRVHLQEYAIDRLTMTEGMDLLCKQGIQAHDPELRSAFFYCDGHAFALMLCASLIRYHHLSLSMLLNDQIYVQLWRGNIASNLLDSMFQQLEPSQQTLLLIFSVLREPLSLNNLYAFVHAETAIPHTQLQRAIEALLSQHLLQATGEGSYQVHAIVANYALEHVGRESREAEKQTLRGLHRQAAHYYLQRSTLNHSTERYYQQRGDIHDRVEVIWHQCQAALYRDAYTFIEQEHLFSELKRLGGTTILLELCLLLLPCEHWSPEPDEAAYIYNHLGDAYRVLGQHEQARKWYQQVLALSQTLHDDAQRGWALNNLGRMDNAQGNSQQAQAYLEQALELFRSMQYPSGLGKVCTNLGWLYYDQGKMEQARNYFEQALHIAQELGDQREEGLLEGYLGRVIDDMGQKREAQRRYVRAVDLLKSSEARHSEGIMLANLGRVTFVLGQSEQGMYYLEQSLQIIKEAGDRSMEGTVTNDLGRLYAEMGQVEKAQDYLKQSLQIRREVGNQRGESRVIVDLGDIDMGQGKIIQAKELYTQALQILRAIEPGWREARPLKKLGDVFSALHQREEALNYYREAIQISRRVKNRWEECSLLFKIGLLYQQQTSYEIALAFFLLAKTTSEEIQHTSYKEIQEKIDLIRIEVGDEQFKQMFLEMEVQAANITKQVL